MPSQAFQCKTFAALFSEGSPQSVFSVKAASSTHKGRPALLFSQDALERISTPYKYALVSKFSRGRQKMEGVHKFFLSLDLREAASVGLLDSRHVFINLSNEVDYHRLWSRSIWYVHGFPMRVFKWSTAFHVDKEPSVAPVWF